jgi:hypothetical protein
MKGSSMAQIRVVSRPFPRKLFAFRFAFLNDITQVTSLKSSFFSFWLLQILDRIPLSAVTRYIHMTREAYLPTKRFKLKLVFGMELFSVLPVLFSLYPPTLCLWNSSAADLLVRHERCRLKKA